jgi:hypothetical protein
MNGKQENEQGRKKARLMGHYDVCPQTNLSKGSDN